jgi:hypothetical protein
MRPATQNDIVITQPVSDELCPRQTFTLSKPQP